MIRSGGARKGNGTCLFMHFCGSNHKATRMQQEENNIKEQKLIAC